MDRLLLLMFAGFFCFFGVAKEKKRSVLLPLQYAQHLKPSFNVDNAQAGRRFLLLNLQASEVEKLSQDIHEKAHVCSGFIDVTEDLNGVKGLDELEGKFLEPKINTLNFSKNLYSIRFSKAVKNDLKLVDRQKYELFLRDLVRFPNRSAQTDLGRKAVDFIESRWKEMSIDYGRSGNTVFRVPSGRFYNQDSVALKIKGKVSGLPAVIVGAHLDTFSGNKPGADDDASGVAALFELYRALLESKRSFNRDIYLIAYGAEEVGLIGSQAVVQYFIKNKIPVQGVMQLDMIGYRSNRDAKDMFFVSDYVDRKLTEFSIELAKEYLGLSEGQVGKFNCYYGCSDHASWFKEGFPVVAPFESSFNNRNRAIHTDNDTIQLLDLNHAIKYVKLAMSFVVELSEPIQ